MSTNSTASRTCAVSVGTAGVDVVVLIVTAVLAVVAIVGLIVSCLRDRSASHGAIGTVLLSLYDVITDFLFLFSMIERSGTPGVTDLTILASAASVLTGLFLR